MQIQPIANTKSDVNFKSANAIDKATEFVNMDDKQLRIISSVSGHDKNKDKKNQKSLARTFWAIPIIDTIASAVLVVKSSRLTEESVSALRKVKLSTRVGVTANTATFWAVSLGAIGLYGLGKKAIENNSPKTKKFNREHPVASFFTDITTIVIGGTLGLMGLSKLANNALKKHPERYDNAVEDLTRIENRINNSKFGKTTLPKLAENMEKFAAKNTLLAKSGRFALANSVWILFGVGIAKIMKHSQKENDRVEHNYRQLKQAQGEVSKQMINVLSQENKFLVGELKATAKDKKCAECSDCCEPEAIKNAPHKKHAHKNAEEIAEKPANKAKAVDKTEQKETEPDETDSVEE